MLLTSLLYSTKIYSTTIMDKTLNYTSYRVYGMIAAQAFFETKLGIRSFQHISKFSK